LSRFIITGGAGYIGSHLSSRLLDEGHNVKIIDKIPIKKATRLKPILKNKKLRYSQLDISKAKNLASEFKGYDTVIHFAANLDIPSGYKHTDLDLRQGTILTYNVLEAMRLCNIKKIIFPSSSTVYGHASKTPTSEDTGMLFPISLYGTAKLSSEALISAFCYLYDMKSWIFRFGTIIGNDMKRGVIFDLINKIRKNQSDLKVLGDGKQIKDYIHMDDCIDGILHVYKNTDKKINIFNLSSGTIISVKEIVKMILDEMNLPNMKIKYVKGPKGWETEGWPGNVKSFQYDITKIRRTGWTPKLSSHEAVRLSIRQKISLDKKSH